MYLDIRLDIKECNCRPAQRSRPSARQHLVDWRDKSFFLLRAEREAKFGCILGLQGSEVGHAVGEVVAAAKVIRERLRFSPTAASASRSVDWLDIRDMALAQTVATFTARL